MIYMRVLDQIKANVDELSKRVVKDFLNREETKSYRKFTEEFHLERVNDIFSDLISWLEKEKPKIHMEKYYKELGKKRFQAEIPLHETIMYLMLIKRHIWLFVLENHLLDTTYESTKALELNNRIVLFFDRAIINVTIGYEEELAKEMKDAGHGGLIRSLLKKGKA
jgi:hypothetical protein